MPRPIRVGIADDDETVRLVLTSVLSQRKEIQLAATVEDGAAAVQLARSGAVDVLVMDLEMPNMTGDEALRLIRESAPDVRVIMHSSKPAASASAEMLRQGAAAYLQKPCDHRELVRVIVAQGEQ